VGLGSDSVDDFGIVSPEDSLVLRSEEAILFPPVPTIRSRSENGAVTSAGKEELGLETVSRQSEDTSADGVSCPYCLRTLSREHVGNEDNWRFVCSFYSDLDGRPLFITDSTWIGLTS
jgi:hypothetical protein